MKKLLFTLLAFFVLSSYAANQVYMGGDFLISLLAEDDDDINHVTGLVAYNPDDDTYVDVFNGGVYRNGGYVSVIQDTPLGVYGAGVFRFVGNEYKYSSNVVHYNADDDEWEPVNDGIFLRTGESIRFIAGMKDYTVFAGTFTSVEYISMKEKNSGDNDQLVPSIVKIDDEQKWSILSDPYEVFPKVPFIYGLAATSSKTFVYAVDSLTNIGALYSWDDHDHFVSIDNSTKLDSQRNIAADIYDNLGGIRFNSNTPVADGQFDFVFFNATNRYLPVYHEVTLVTSGTCGEELAPSTWAWADGFLIAVPNNSTSCATTQFAFFNSTSHTLLDTDAFTAVPEFYDSIDHLAVGDDNSLWIINYSDTLLYYLPAGSNQFIEIDLSVFGTGFSATSLTWVKQNGRLLVSGSIELKDVLLEVDPDAFPPAVKVKSPGMLATAGTINSLSIMDDPDDDDYELYIGGNFDSIAGGLQGSNFVRYKAGVYDTPLPNLPPIVAMTTVGSTIFYATDRCSRNGGQLPIGYYSKDTKQADVWVNVPVVTDATSGCVTALYADENVVVVAGDFDVLLPGGTTAAKDIVYFDRATATWNGVAFPGYASGVSSSNQINTVTAAKFGDVPYIAVGGHFQFTISGDDTVYCGFAMVNLQTKQWVPPPTDFGAETIVNDIILDDLTRVYIAGFIALQSSTAKQGVFVFDVNQRTYTQAGNLPTAAQSILLYNTEEDDNDVTLLYAAGDFRNLTAHAGLAYTDATVVQADTVYHKAGLKSQFWQYFEGTVNDLVYETGGVGQNDDNGNDPQYSPPNLNGDDGGMSGWGKFFLTVFILLVITLVVVGVAGGGYVYWKKRQNYQQL